MAQLGWRQMCIFLVEGKEILPYYLSSFVNSTTGIKIRFKKSESSMAQI